MCIQMGKPVSEKTVGDFSINAAYTYELRIREVVQYDGM